MKITARKYANILRNLFIQSYQNSSRDVLDQNQSHWLDVEMKKGMFCMFRDREYISTTATLQVQHTRIWDRYRLANLPTVGGQM